MFLSLGSISLSVTQLLGSEHLSLEPSPLSLSTSSSSLEMTTTFSSSFSSSSESLYERLGLLTQEPYIHPQRNLTMEKCDYPSFEPVIEQMIGHEDFEEEELVRRQLDHSLVFSSFLQARKCSERLGICDEGVEEPDHQIPLLLCLFLPTKDVCLDLGYHP